MISCFPDLLGSSASETEADKSSSSETRCDSGGTSEEMGGTSEEVGGARECPVKIPGTAVGDSRVFNIHLSIPGVLHPMDVMVMIVHVYCVTLSSRN